MIDIGKMLPVRWQKDHSRKGFFHKEMGTKSQAILSKWQNVKLLDWYEKNLPVKWQNYHSQRGFFHKEMGTIGQEILCKWQNVKLLE